MSSSHNPSPIGVLIFVLPLAIERSMRKHGKLLSGVSA